MDNVTERAAEQKPIPKGTIEWMLKAALHLPKFWLIISIIFIFLSLFNISWVPLKSLSISFQVTSATAVFLALTWLPALIRVFALVGGGIKTPAGEFTSSGLTTLLSQLKQETLGVLISETTTAEEKVPLEEKAKTSRIRQELEEAYVSRIPPGQIHEQLAQLVERYKQLRTSMRSGPERTFQMESVMGGIRAIVSKTRLSLNEMIAYLQSNDEGKRLVGISSIQLNGDERYFDYVVQMLNDPQSAFEQYQVLRAVQKMLPYLNQTQKYRLKEVLIKQRDYEPNKKQWIMPGSDRDWLSTRILSTLGLI